MWRRLLVLSCIEHHNCRERVGSNEIDKSMNCLLTSLRPFLVKDSVPTVSATNRVSRSYLVLAVAFYKRVTKLGNFTVAKFKNTILRIEWIPILYKHKWGTLKFLLTSTNIHHWLLRGLGRRSATLRSASRRVHVTRWEPSVDAGLRACM